MQALRAYRQLQRKSSVRWFAAQTQVVDEMILYARTQCQGKPDQARDVLKQGLGSDKPKGADAGRLLLALADVEQETSDWARIVELAQAASRAAQGAEPGSDEEAVTTAEVQMEAGWVETRARLTLGDDAQAATVADQGVEAVQGMFFQAGAEQRLWQALVLANSNVAMLQHATGDLHGADITSTAVLALAQHTDQKLAAFEEADRDRYIPSAWKQVAALRAAQGQTVEAMKLYQKATHAAKAALESDQGGAGVLQSLTHLGDAVADSLLGQAQTLFDTGKQDDAEQVLSDALSAAEGVSGEGHPRVALVLLELGRLYARTARVSYAEGLYREAAKQLRLDREPKPRPQLPLHASAAALLCWRYAQLLTALPKRTTEAEQWAGRANAYYGGAAGLNALPLQGVFGDLDALKQGGGKSGSGAILNLTLRRALPMVVARKD